MTPRERDMTVVTATRVGAGWRIEAPGQSPRWARDRRSAEELIARDLCGAAVRWIERAER